jgi:bacillithiol biosynthesis deacetylase BshB1
MDLLVFGAHPDDCELFVGGTIAKLVRLGYEVGMVDLTEGEMSSRGTLEERQRETAAASGILGVKRRVNLGLGDTLLQNTAEARLRVVEVLREYRPETVIYQYPEDRHPDHIKGGILVRDACFYAHLKKIETKQEPFAPRHEILFLGNIVGKLVNPTFVVDIAETFDQKMAAVKAYRSQFYNPDYKGSDTFISSKEFFEMSELRARFYGSLIGVRYGEAFIVEKTLRIDDVCAFFQGGAG